MLYFCRDCEYQSHSTVCCSVLETRVAKTLKPFVFCCIFMEVFKISGYMSVPTARTGRHKSSLGEAWFFVFQHIKTD